MQQFRADSGTGFVTATMAAAGCSMQFVLPNRTPLPATRVAGLVQIAVSALLRTHSVGEREALAAEHCRYGTIDLASTEDTERLTGENGVFQDQSC